MTQSVWNQLLLLAPAFWPLSNSPQKVISNFWSNYIKIILETEFAYGTYNIEPKLLFREHSTSVLGRKWFGKVNFLKSWRQSPYKMKKKIKNQSTVTAIHTIIHAALFMSKTNIFY